jgi:hypothetical protein
MLILPPSPVRKGRPPLRPWSPRPPAPALTLVGAVLEKNRAWVRLTFDRAVDAGAFDPAGVWVGHQPSGRRYDAAGPATLFTPQTVQAPLVGGALYFGDTTRLFAPATTGIVAAGDGQAWAGVVGLALPFP